MTLSKRTDFGLDLPILSILYLVSIYYNQLQSITTYAILILEKADCPRGASELLHFKCIRLLSLITYYRLLVRSFITRQRRLLVRLPLSAWRRRPKTGTKKVFEGVTLLIRITNRKLAIPHPQVSLISSVYLLCKSVKLCM